MAATDKRDPWTDFMALREELRLYKKVPPHLLPPIRIAKTTQDMLDRHAIVIANKMDLAEAAEKLNAFKEKMANNKETRDLPLFEVSAKEKTNVVAVTDYLKGVMDSIEAQREADLKASGKPKPQVVDLSAQYQKYFDEE